MMDNERVAKELVKIAKNLTAKDFPYAVIRIDRYSVSWSVSFGDERNNATGRNPYGKEPMVAIEDAFYVIRKMGVDENMVEIIT